jgi:hypothetical protein
MHRFLKKKLVYAYLHELMNVMIFSSLTIKSSTYVNGRCILSVVSPGSGSATCEMSNRTTKFHCGFRVPVLKTLETV